MFEDALRYPSQGDDTLQIIAIGGILSILGFLIIPAILVGGYLLRVYRQVMAGETAEPPTFANWESLLGDGLRGFVIVLAYFIIPFALLFVTVGTAVVAVAVGVASGGAISPEASFALGGLAALGAFLAFILLLVAWYILPAAIANFVRTDRVGGAFAFGEVVDIATSSSYVVAWVLALVVSFLGGIITSILGATVIGAVLSPFVGFYVAVSMAYLYARGSAEAREDEAGSQSPTGRPAA